MQGRQEDVSAGVLLLLVSDCKLNPHQAWQLGVSQHVQVLWPVMSSCMHAVDSVPWVPAFP